MHSINAVEPKKIVQQPNRGKGGPRVFMPVLAKYVETGEIQWGNAIVAMLKAFHIEMQKQVAERKWF